MNKENWRSETKADLFSHLSMATEAQRVDAYSEASGTGALGRMMDVLHSDGLAVYSSSVARKTVMLEGDPSTGRLPDVMSPHGPSKFLDRNFLLAGNQQLRGYLESLHGETHDNSGLFANIWSQSFIDVW